jgi:enoyl-CoA hydratase/carnithine racemase
MLRVDDLDGVVFLRVGQPAGANHAARLAAELVEVCRDIEERDELPVAVALLGEGPDFWLAEPNGAAACDALGAGWGPALSALAGIGPPTVALVQGNAIGPAWEVALACDLRLAADTVRLGSPELRWGRIPAAGGSQRLTRLVGPATALRLLLLGQVIPASEAQALGLVHQVAPPDELSALLDELLDSMRGSAPIALSYARETVHRALDLPLADGLRLEADLAALLQTTHDRAEGIAAFLARRPARFEGR